MQEILSLFHHIHHLEGEHKVHHCGGEHKTIDPKVDYTIKHCSCSKHSIDEKTAIGHGTDENLNPVETEIEFSEACPEGGWLVESGTKVSKE